MPQPATLAFSLATVPGVLVSATARHGHQARLEITAAHDRSGPGAVRCRAITVTVPTGFAAGRLTGRPDRIDTAYRAARTWHIAKNITDPDTAVFTLRPQNPRREAVFDDTTAVTLVLDRIPLISTATTVDLQVTAELALGTGAFARAAPTALRVTVLPPATDPA